MKREINKYDIINYFLNSRGRWINSEFMDKNFPLGCELGHDRFIICQSLDGFGTKSIHVDYIITKDGVEIEYKQGMLKNINLEKYAKKFSDALNRIHREASYLEEQLEIIKNNINKEE